VYAKWNAIYTVIFNKNNSDSGSTNAIPTTKTVTVPATTIDALPTEPTRTGYAFDGWYTSDDGGTTLGGEFTASTAVAASITVYAKWVTCELTVTAPLFSDVLLIYPQPAAEHITITNSGTGTATISGVTVSPDTAFTIGGSGSTVAAGGSISSWTIQPKRGLSLGTHTATITVTYNGSSSTTVTADVEITINPMVFNRIKENALGLIGQSRIYNIVYGTVSGIGTFVAGGVAGLPPDTGTTQIATSADSITWTHNDTPMNYFRTIVYGDGKFVAGGDSGSISTSLNGTEWTLQSNPFPTGTGAVFGMAYGTVSGAGLFVAVGRSRLNPEKSMIATSPDGILWTERASPFGAENIFSIAYNGGRFVAGSRYGKIATSPDGITWTLQTSPFDPTPPAPESILSITYGGGKFVAGSRGGKIATSPDGITWTLQSTPFAAGDYIQAIGYGGGLFIAASYSDHPYPFSTKLGFSDDGITWVVQTIPYHTMAIWYGNGQFLISGDGDLYAMQYP
jgi:uncharacterized repeat protein (TIGR02543 family)